MSNSAINYVVEKLRDLEVDNRSLQQSSINIFRRFYEIFDKIDLLARENNNNKIIEVAQKFNQFKLEHREELKKFDMMFYEVFKILGEINDV